MVSGKQPFKGHYDKAVMYSITSEEPEPLTALRTGVPMELEWIVGKCLAKDADGHYQHTSDMAVDLKNLQEKLTSGRSAILKTSVGARHAAELSKLTRPGSSGQPTVSPSFPIPSEPNRGADPSAQFCCPNCGREGGNRSGSVKLFIGGSFSGLGAA